MAHLNETQLKRLLFFFLTLIITVVLFTSCTKTIIYPPKKIDVVFKFQSKNIEVKQHAKIGFNENIVDTVFYGDLNYVLKMNEGFCGKVTFLVKSEIYTPVNMSIIYGNELTSHICTELDTVIHGFQNETIYIPCN